jgi:hypothetical protein
VKGLVVETTLRSWPSVTFEERKRPDSLPYSLRKGELQVEDVTWDLPKEALKSIEGKPAYLLFLFHKDSPFFFVLMSTGEFETFKRFGLAIGDGLDRAEELKLDNTISGSVMQDWMKNIKKQELTLV